MNESQPDSSTNQETHEEYLNNILRDQKLEEIRAQKQIKFMQKLEQQHENKRNGQTNIKANSI